MTETLKKVLMIAFHYPPWRGGSGIHRTLYFSRYLPQHGWQPLILTAHPRAYPEVGSDQLEQIPTSALVKRVFALNVAKHMSLRGAYPKWLALPDRWSTWWLGAVPAGIWLIRKHRPRVIWSTYPIATAHLIGLTLHRLTGIPWVADFRDPMTEEAYPTDRMTRSVYRWIESRTVSDCTCAVFTAPGTLHMYAARYPQKPRSHWAIIANGYDEEEFREVERAVGERLPAKSPLVLVHSGVLYPSERDPHAFFAAVADLRRSGQISPASLKIVLRGSGHEDVYGRYLREHGIEDIVCLAPPIAHRDALMEMLEADGLLLFQAANCNHQIPAKIYEYLRAKRPIFAMTDPESDTARLLRKMGTDTIVCLDSKQQIAKGLWKFLQELQRCYSLIRNHEEIFLHSRKSRTCELAKLFDAYHAE